MSSYRIAQERPAWWRRAARATQSDGQTSIEKQAAEWIVKLEMASTPELRARFHAWRNSDPRHHQACCRLELAWHRAGLLLDAHRNPAYGNARSVVLDRLGSASEPLFPIPSALIWLTASGVPAVLAGIVLLLVLLLPLGRTIANDSHGIAYVRLQDGTSVTLGPATRMRVRQTDTRRLVDLKSGEAVFAVAHQRRPFEVQAGGTLALARGTVFSVRFDDAQSLVVAVKQGRVAVTRRGNEENLGRSDLPATVPILTAGETATIGPQRLHIDPSPARKLRFRRTALALAVQEFNLYHVRQLRIVDPSIESMKLGGDLSPTDLDEFIAALAAYDIEATPQGSEILLHGRAP